MILITCEQKSAPSESYSWPRVASAPGNGVLRQRFGVKSLIAFSSAKFSRFVLEHFSVKFYYNLFQQDLLYRETKKCPIFQSSLNKIKFMGNSLFLQRILNPMCRKWCLLAKWKKIVYNRQIPDCCSLGRTYVRWESGLGSDTFWSWTISSCWLSALEMEIVNFTVGNVLARLFDFNFQILRLSFCSKVEFFKIMMDGNVKNDSLSKTVYFFFTLMLGFHNFMIFPLLEKEQSK